jgi:hypothetical protein
VRDLLNNLLRNTSREWGARFVNRRRQTEFFNIAWRAQVFAEFPTCPLFESVAQAANATKHASVTACAMPVGAHEATASRQRSNAKATISDSEATIIGARRFSIERLFANTLSRNIPRMVEGRFVRPALFDNPVEMESTHPVLRTYGGPGARRGRAALDADAYVLCRPGIQSVLLPCP